MAVFKRDKWTCVYCGYKGGPESFDAYLRGNWQCDHWDPDGGDTLENCVTACGQCNMWKKKNKFATPEATREWLRLYREEIARPWFEHHVVRDEPASGWNKIIGPAFNRLKELARPK
jgi:hypothetical protein